MAFPAATELFTVLGGLGVFLFGLRVMSGGLQKLAGARLRSVLAGLTRNRFTGVFSGFLITCAVQSSSATTVLVVSFANAGLLTLTQTLGLVMGANIGTTVTAQLASIGANRDARRVATFHTLFNVIGVCWMLLAMPLVLALVRMIISGDAETNMLVATTQVALFHTLFNVTNTGLLIGFVAKLEALVMRLVPVRGDELESTHLEFLESGLLGTPELAGVEVRRGVEQMVKVCRDAFTKVTEVITNPETRLGSVVEDIWREEQKTDDMELEIIEFCSQWARSGTSESVGRDVARFLEMANDIERIGDHCTNLVLLAQRRFDKGYSFDAGAQAELASMATHVDKILLQTIAALRSPDTIDMASAKMLEQKINRLRDESRQSETKRVEQAGYDLRRGLLFLDMMTNMEKIGDYCWNVIKMMQTSSDDS